MNAAPDEQYESMSESGDEIEVPENAAEIVPVSCFFCASTYNSAEEVWAHCRSSHQVDISSLKRRCNLNCFSYIRLVNYLRRERPDPASIPAADPQLWLPDVYMNPVVPDDPMLMYDIEDDEGVGMTCNIEQPALAAEAGAIARPEGDACVDQQLVYLQELLRRKECEVQALHKALNTLRVTASRILTADNHPPEEGEGYFATYNTAAIHQEMLQDKIRTVGYRDAILSNASLFKDKDVLDVGCGTGILSLFCAKAGAKMVYAVDKSDIIYSAIEIIRENNYEDKIKPLKGRMEDVHLDGDERVDIIVSEWMGYALLFEGMLETVIYAREKHLRPGGLIFPNRCTLSIVGVSDLEKHNEMVGFWDDVYGFSMGFVKRQVLAEVAVECIPEDKLATEPQVCHTVDMSSCTAEDLEFSSPMKLSVLKDCELTSVAIYFDAFFDFEKATMFSTGPGSAATHWKQTVAYFGDPLPCKKGEVLEGSLEFRRQARDRRAYTVYLKVREEHYRFDIS